MTEGEFDTEITLSVRVVYRYGYSAEIRQTMNDPGEPASEDIDIETIHVLDANGKILGQLDQSWLNEIEEEAICDMIRDDVQTEPEPDMED